MQFFDELGRVVEQRWKDRDYDEAAFPAIAEQVLLEMKATARVEPLQIIRDLHTRGSLPGQHGEEFSDLPLTLYAGPRFYVDVYFWLDGTTSIHQHGFSGAFQVLSGSSIHSVYSFEREREINVRFATGRILLKDVQVLEKGDIRKIQPGERFIHSLFHLDRPSSTITVRTHVTPNNLPQYTYLKPCLATDPFFREQLTLKKLASITMLLRMNHPEAYPLISELISAADAQTTFLILTAVFEHLVNSAREKNFNAPDVGDEAPDGWEAFHELFRTAHARHGSLINLLTPVLGEMQRQASIVELRTCVTGSEHRFFLALLLNVTDRIKVLDLVRQRFPDRNPIDAVCDWLRQFSNMRTAMSTKRNILGIDDFSDAHLFVLRNLLEGAPLEEIKGRSAEASAVEGIPQGEEIEKIYRSLQSSVLIKSLSL